MRLKEGWNKQKNIVRSNVFLFCSSHLNTFAACTFCLIYRPTLTYLKVLYFLKLKQDVINLYFPWLVKPSLSSVHQFGKHTFISSLVEYCRLLREGELVEVTCSSWNTFSSNYSLYGFDSKFNCTEMIWNYKYLKMRKTWN